MTVAEFANLYVTTIEPVLKTLFFILLGILMVWFVMLLKSGEKKGDIINALVTGIWKGIVASFIFIGLAFAWIFKLITRIVTVVIASIRDFFTSEV